MNLVVKTKEQMTEFLVYSQKQNNSKIPPTTPTVECNFKNMLLSFLGVCPDLWPLLVPGKARSWELLSPHLPAPFLLFFVILP